MRLSKWLLITAVVLACTFTPASTASAQMRGQRKSAVSGTMKHHVHKHHHHRHHHRHTKAS